MTKAKLIQMIHYGTDIMLDVADRHFTILSWEEAEFTIAEQDPCENKPQSFRTAEALVEHFMIGGVSLGELAEEVVITDYTLSRWDAPNNL